MEGLKKVMESFLVWISRKNYEQGAEYDLEDLSAIKNTIKI
jgi:hypothetical protein